MGRALTIVLLLLPAGALAQPPDDLKAVRSSLERLERSQKALIALTRIQVDEARLAALEAQRLPLLDREQELGKRTDSAPTRTSNEARPLPTLVAIRPDGTTEIAQTTPAATLAPVRRERQDVEQSIDALKKRIAVWEKYFDALKQAEPK